jgi:DNA (cytosine-5)-methyltransferase 1
LRENLTTEEKLNELHLFAGAGGGILGGILLGHTTVCAVEIEPYCRKVLLQRQRDGILPKFPIWDDVRTFDGKPWRGKVDIVCGGFPCQDISCAGKGEGIEGERSGMWTEMARIIYEIRPKYAFVENSPMLTSRGLGVVLGDLASMGYDARWGVLGADCVGLPHHRSRIWVVAYPTKGGLPILPSQSSRGEAEEILRSRARTYNPHSLQSCSSGGLRIGANEPALLRGCDGLANGCDRLAAIGNGQVPIVAALAWKTLTNEI